LHSGDSLPIVASQDYNSEGWLSLPVSIVDIQFRHQWW